MAALGDGDNVLLTSEDDLLQKHKKERKDFLAHSQKLKHGVPKGDKKKKKEVTAEIARLEAELDARQEQELSDFKENKTQVSDVTSGIADLSTSAKQEDDTSTSELQKPKKTSKAQKRREKKAQEEKDREERIQEQEIQNLLGARHLESEKLKSLLGERNLAVFQIPSDGNCLYKAVEHQLTTQNVETNVDELRKKAADYMRGHTDDFMPFLTKPDSGDPYTEDDFVKYCMELETTAAWGGQLEVRALSLALGRPIEVVQAEGPTVLTGEEYSTTPIILLYYRHAYGLGEHYNSVTDKPEEDDEDDGFS